MIALLRGRVAAVAEEAVVVDVAGVGYLVHCAPSTLARLPRAGEAVELFTELHVREDAILLYGFLDPAERGWFRLLQTVQGVGARVALSILGTLPPGPAPDGPRCAGDRAALTRAAGVGARLAARIVAELKDRVGALRAPAWRQPRPRLRRRGRPPRRRAVGPGQSRLPAQRRLRRPRPGARLASARRPASTS